jgi:uncharacterized membrane protein
MGYYDERPLEEGPDLGYANPRVIMIRRIKGIILIILLVLMIFLMYIQFTTEMSKYKGHYKPIFPMEPILFALLLMAFIMTIVSVIFKAVEIKVSETGSQKYLLANSSMKAAVTTMVIAIVFAIIIYIIPSTPGAMDILNSEDKSQVEYGNQTYSFSSEDEFLISETTAVEYKITNGVNVNSSIFPKNDYEKGDYSSEVNEANSRLYYQDGTTQFKYKGKLDYGKYVVVVENNEGDTANIEYTVYRKVKDSLLYTLLIFCIMFAVLEGIWAGVAAAIKHKYKADSIYR